MLLVAEPILGEKEKAALLGVVDSGWITMGDRVRMFEQNFAKIHGVPDAVAVSSCTAALHLILETLGIGPGDEVLVPSLTFVATINAVLYTGATPVFVDIESLDWPVISRSDASDKCTAKTKAVMLMHYAGYVADREEWRHFAECRRLMLIEDAAHAAGAAHAGTFGDAAAFSFYGNKNITTAEGGIVTAAEASVLEKIRRKRSHGTTSATFERYTKRTVGYDVTMLGYNYRMDELRAAIGVVQLDNLLAWNGKRRILTQLYNRYLATRCPTVGLPFANWRPPSDRASSHHIMPVVLPKGVDRRNVINALRDAGVQTSNHYPAAHQLSFYRARFPTVHLGRTEEFCERQLTLPLHPRMDEYNVEIVADALAKAVS